MSKEDGGKEADGAQGGDVVIELVVNRAEGLRDRWRGNEPPVEQRIVEIDASVSDQWVVEGLQVQRAGGWRLVRLGARKARGGPR